MNEIPDEISDIEHSPNPMDEIYLRTLVMHIASGLLASQCPDFRYLNQPDRTREDHLAQDAFKYAEAIMKKFSDTNK